ncbi:MAG: hypothetical protein P8Y02_00830 [Deinococcales bacterium]
MNERHTPASRSAGSRPLAPRRPAVLASLLVAGLVAALLGSTAFAQSSSNASSSSQCRQLQKTQYWQVSFLIAPMPNPLPSRTQAAMDGFTLNTSKNADGTLNVDIERQGRSDNETNETPDQDDIKVDTSKQKLYFLEGQMGDDAVGIDTHLNDEAVVLTDLNGCILH